MLLFLIFIHLIEFLAAIAVFTSPSKIWWRGFCVKFPTDRWRKADLFIHFPEFKYFHPWMEFSGKGQTLTNASDERRFDFIKREDIYSPFRTKCFPFSNICTHMRARTHTYACMHAHTVLFSPLNVIAWRQDEGQCQTLSAQLSI